MTRDLAALATAAIGAGVTTSLVAYLRSNRDRIAAALAYRPIRPHD